MNPVNWFEIPVVDLARARRFYEAVLGAQLMDLPSPVPGNMAAFPWEQGGRNAAGALVEMPGAKPSADGTLVYFECSDLAIELARVESAGGRPLTPKTPIGEFGFIAHALDTEGNRFGLHSLR